MNLSNQQKGILSRLARQVWDRLPEAECARVVAEAAEALNDPLVSDAQAFTWWRHREQERACGVASLRTATQDDFLRIRGWWGSRLPGASGWAFRDLMKADDEPTARVRWLLERATRERGLEWPSYPDKICRAQYRCGLRQATEQQLWRLLFTVRNRRPRKPASA